LSFAESQKIGVSYQILFNTIAPEEMQIDVVKQGWKATESAVKKIVDTAGSVRSKTIILVVPHFLQLRPEVESIARELAYPIEVDYGELRIEKMGRELGVPVVKLKDVFEQELDVVLPYVDGHFNRAAHRRVGDHLADEIVRNFPEFFSRTGGPAK
jgi:hypothetical protein